MRIVVRSLIGVILTGGLVTATPLLPAGVTSTALQDPAKPPQQQTDVVVTLDNRSKNPRVGVPAFAVTGDAKVREAADLVADVLWADLDYEREFYMINRKSSASIPAAATPATLPFDQWKQIGADYVLMGSAKASGS